MSLWFLLPKFKQDWNTLRPHYAMKNENYSISVDIEKYQSVKELQHAISKIDFSMGANVYMLPNDLKFNK